MTVVPTSHAVAASFVINRIEDFHLTRGISDSNSSNIQSSLGPYGQEFYNRDALLPAFDKTQEERFVLAKQRSSHVGVYSFLVFLLSFFPSHVSIHSSMLLMRLFMVTSVPYDGLPGHTTFIVDVESG